MKETVYCEHRWGDQMTGSDGAFRICKSCQMTWMDGQPEPRIAIAKIEEMPEFIEEPYDRAPR